MAISKIKRLALATAALIAAVATGVMLFVESQTREHVDPGSHWYIRNNAIRQLISRSSASEYVVIRTYGGLDLLVCGRSTPDAIDQLIRNLGVEKYELVDKQGYTFLDSWSDAMPVGKWQFHFKPGSVLVEDVVQDERTFFVHLLYSPESDYYVIAINNAARILQRMK
ncbi:MAG: hypothetical protein R3F13_21365 [Prosthecobacter sp.]